MQKTSAGNAELLALIARLRGCDCTYVPNPGNAGDSLIALATYQLFERHGLQVEVGHHSGHYPGRVVILGGGGNLIPEYKDIYQAILRNKDTAEELILLPHTVHGYDELLASLDERCILFGREERSFTYLKQQALRATVHLADDMAFTVDLSELSTLPMLNPGIVTTEWPARRARRLRRMLKIQSGRLRHGGTLNAIRLDREKTDVEVPPHNFDLSDIFMDNVLDRRSVWQTVSMLAATIRPYRKVRTNRLHVAVLAALMGREVEMLDNSYGKNSAVYETSMQHMTNVTFVS
ncbi:MAG: polysaccharide pyruvyl transferase family protein [Pseudomonadota bacterium]